MNVLSPQVSKYRISRRGKKLQSSDDSRILITLPKDIPEKTWAEILQKEENDLLIFDIREEILEAALKIGYDNYMERQNAPFTVFCAAQAWLKLIDWHFYRHDPGEEPSAYPPCFIPKRVESWEPDKLPDPSPKDGWCREDLNVVDCSTDDTLQLWPSDTSLECPTVEEIPSEYWFPGKVTWSEEDVKQEPDVVTADSYSYASDASRSEEIGADSELVQHVTDYSTEGLSKKESTSSGLKLPTPAEEGSLHGAGDSTIREKKKHERSRHNSRVSVSGRSRGALPPLERDSRDRVSLISDCRLRSLRLDTQYEISSEKVDTPPGETVKRK